MDSPPLAVYFYLYLLCIIVHTNIYVFNNFIYFFLSILLYGLRVVSLCLFAATFTRFASFFFYCIRALCSHYFQIITYSIVVWYFTIKSNYVTSTKVVQCKACLTSFFIRLHVFTLFAGYAIIGLHNNK